MNKNQELSNPNSNASSARNSVDNSNKPAYKRQQNMKASGRNLLAELKSKEDKHMLEISRLEKKINQHVKFGDQQIVNKFETHVERGFFDKNLEAKVNKDMQEL